MRQVPISPDDVRLVNGTECDCLGYADDVDLLGITYWRRDPHLSHFRAAGERTGLRIREVITKDMKESRTKREEGFIHQDGFMLEVVDQFNYLESLLTSAEIGA